MCTEETRGSLILFVIPRAVLFLFLGLFLIRFFEVIILFILPMKQSVTQYMS